MIGDLKNFDSHLRSLSALSRRLPPKVLGIDFDVGYNVQTKTVRISRLIGNGNVATASGSFNTATSLTVTTTLSPNVQDSQPNFAIPFVAIYTGTAAVAANQIYPKFGSGIANAKYSIHSGFDYRTWDGINSVFMVNIENNSGTTTSVYAETQWKIVNYGYGTSS